MIVTADIRKIARGRLQDARILFDGKRFDGALYLCGYAVELALKARICRTLKWDGYPETNSEFQAYQSFRTHELDVLLRLSGREKTIKFPFLAEWSVVKKWSPKSRYQPLGSATAADAQLMIDAAETLMKKI